MDGERVKHQLAEGTVDLIGFGALHDVTPPVIPAKGPVDLIRFGALLDVNPPVVPAKAGNHIFESCSSGSLFTVPKWLSHKILRIRTDVKEKTNMDPRFREEDGRKA